MHRTCLAETDIDKLEDLWRELDERWMQIKHWIDIVPDIEYGMCRPALSTMIRHKACGVTTKASHVSDCRLWRTPTC